MAEIQTPTPPADPTVRPTARVLPPAEFARLQGLPIFETVQGTDTLVVVVERGDRIIGTWALLLIPHLEGCWIDPADRGHVAAAKLLVGEMFTALQTMGVQQAVTITQTLSVGALADKLGGHPIEGQIWVIPVPAPTPTETM